MYILKTTLELGCLYAPVALALFLSFRILNIADMTTDGCFILSGAVSVMCALHGHPIAGIFLGMLAGGMAGCITALLQTRCGVPSILAGIITNTGLYTINLMVMGFSSNVAILKGNTIFTLFAGLGLPKEVSSIVLAFLIVCTAMIGLRYFLSTHLGLCIRATGDNSDMVSASSIDPRFTITVGLIISNMLTGLSGAMTCQFQKSADINGGTGIVVIGLACLIIGETLCRSYKSITRNIVACLIGNLVYRCIYAVILSTHILPIECLKLMTAFIVALAIASPTIKENMAKKKRRSGQVC